MRNPSQPLLLLGAIVGLLSACGNNGLPGIVPSIKLTSPTDNTTVNLAPNKLVAVNFETNYTLKAPGSCAGVETCGHVYVLVDNTNCNLPNLPYNRLAVSSPTEADFGKCAMATGMHTLLLELHHDDGSVVKTLTGNPVTDRVTVTTQ